MNLPLLDHVVKGNIYEYVKGNIYEYVFELT